MKKNELITIHDSKSQLLDFFNEYEENKVNLFEVDLLKQKLKTLKKFNKIIEKKRIELEDYVEGGLNVKNNMAVLKNEKKIELDIPNNIRKILSNDYGQFKLKEFYLKEIDTFKYENDIKFNSGKKFDFILDTGFSKHKIKFDELKKDVVLSEENFVLKLIKKYKEDVDNGYKNDKKNKTKKEFQKLSKAYSKIYKVISHNENIASNKEYTKPLFERNEKGDFVRTEGDYPIMFELLDYIINIYIP